MHEDRTLSRRHALGLLGGGLGATALAPVLGAARLAPEVPAELPPHFPARADRVAFLLTPGGARHGAASLALHTGSTAHRCPSVGAWAVYGRGRGSADLPGFVTLQPMLAHGGAGNWSAGFLPGACQGAPLGDSGDPRTTLSHALDRADQQSAGAAHGDSRARRRAAECAERLQSDSARLLADGEAPAVAGLLGRGVRFVQWTLAASPPTGVLEAAAVAALASLFDALEAADLLATTRVLWAMPHSASAEPGYALWAAGADAGRDLTPAGDLHAEVLAALGLDARRLGHPLSGRVLSGRVSAQSALSRA
jgi:hypothetical protein